jgi:carbamoylphosphate synthase large subunit
MENQIETKTSDELTLLLQQCHQQIRINEANIQIILQEANARLQRHQAVEKEAANDK